LGQEINLLDQYPRSKRPIDERASLVTKEHRRIAQQFGKEYFDGGRLHGYNGYNYHPRFWQATVARICDHYGLSDNASVLDIGCAKGFMLHDFKELMPGIKATGIDVSPYALENAMDAVKPFLELGNAKELPYEDDSFDLVISINCIHNLEQDECRKALSEMERVSRGNSFVVVDAWRNDIEKQNLLKWNLTAQTYMHADDWRTVFDETGYTGDFFWFIAE